MSTTTASASSASTASPHSAKSLLHVGVWPPLVYLLLGVVCFTLWAAGTAMQVQTSEAWMLDSTTGQVSIIATFAQLWLFVQGGLSTKEAVPFVFAWGVQIALIIASVGVEMPPHPKWRYVLSWGVVILLIIVNSCGDYFYSSPYGTWSQIGFTVVILFVTFCLGLFAIMCFVHAFRKMFP